jgi:integrase
MTAPPDRRKDGRCRNYAQHRERFERYLAAQRGLPSVDVTNTEACRGFDLGQAVRDYLKTLPLSAQMSTFHSLRSYIGERVDWTQVRPYVRKYRRDEPKLRNTVLLPADREHLWGALSTLERALIGVLYALRRAEVTTLRWKDVSLDTGRVFVQAGKGGKAGWTALPNAATEALGAWHTESKPQSPECLVFPGPGGRFLHPDSIGRRVRQALRRAGMYVQWRGPHAFRRTFACAFLRQHPGQLLHLQRAMRHSRLETTNLYIYLSDDEVAASVQKLDV